VVVDHVIEEEQPKSLYVYKSNIKYPRLFVSEN